MAEISFEEIRKNALAEITQNLGDNPYEKMLQVCVDISSKVTELMLEKYHQQLHEGP